MTSVGKWTKYSNGLISRLNYDDVKEVKNKIFENKEDESDIEHTQVNSISDVRTSKCDKNGTCAFIAEYATNHIKQKKKKKDTKSKRTYDLSTVHVHVRTNADKTIGSGRIPNRE